MTIIWLAFLITFLSSFFGRYFSTPYGGIVPYVKPNKLLIFLVMATFVIVSGLRKNIGDTYFYMHAYEVGDFRLSEFKLNGDYGFFLFQSALHQFTQNPQYLVFITALVTNVCIIAGLYRYSRKIEISIFIYIASGLFTVTMNGIRQSLAASIIFIGTKFLLEGKWKHYLGIVLLASSFHQTALIFLPIYFVVRRPAWSKITFFILAIGIVIVIFFNQFTYILFKTIEDTQYGHYSNFEEGGASVFRALVTLVPLLIAYLGKEKLKTLWTKSDYIVNLAILGQVFMIIATRNWIFARFDIYFSLYNIILMSWIIELFQNHYRRLVYYGILVCYFVYFFYEQVITLGIQYHSNYLPWSG